MTDADKINLFAMRIMGWQLHAHNTAHWVKPGEFAVQAWSCGMNAWNPLLNIVDADTLWNRLDALGWSLWIGPDVKIGWSGQLKRKTDNVHEWVRGVTKCEVICKAALVTLDFV
jgi:hypothetical protein